MGRYDHAADAGQSRSGAVRPHAGVRGGIASGSEHRDWGWITARIVTATGWTFDALNEQSACDILDLLKYWIDEPPAHVTLALRYLGQKSKRGNPRVNEAQARKDLGEIGAMPGLGGAPRPMPANLLEMVRQAEQMKQSNKGLA